MLLCEGVLASASQKHMGEYASGIPAWSVFAQAQHQPFGASLPKTQTCCQLAPPIRSISMNIASVGCKLNGSRCNDSNTSTNTNWNTGHDDN